MFKNKTVRRILAVMLALVCAIALAPALNLGGAASAMGSTIDIKAEPKDVTVAAGKTAKFTVSATGEGTLKYQWQTKAPGSTQWMNSTNASANKTAFSITAQEGHSGYQFRCRITDNGSGDVEYTRPATLTVTIASGLKIVKQPKSLSIVIGTQGIFAVTAVGSTSLTYQWQTKAPGTTTWKSSTAASAKTPEFKLIAQAAHDKYKVRCIIKDAKGKTVATSEVSVVTYVPINSTYFPDANFRKAVKKYDTNKDSKLRGTELLAVTKINVVGEAEEPENMIKNMDGIQYFTALKVLWCGRNQIESLDLSMNKQLLELDCHWNNIKELDLRANTKLKRIICNDSYVETLIVSGCKELTYLDCSCSDVSSLYLAANTELKVLLCYGCNLTKLDLNKCKKLTHLECDSNKITTLAIGSCTLLKDLECGNNYLTSLYLKNLKKLEGLVCSVNYLEKLDVTNNPNLVYLQCQFNDIEVLDLRNNPNLDYDTSVWDSSVTVIKN